MPQVIHIVMVVIHIEIGLIPDRISDYVVIPLF